MTRRFGTALLLLTALTLAMISFAQPAPTPQVWFTMELGRSPLVGEPVTLTLRALLPPGTTITAWPALPRDWPPFEVSEVAELEVAERPEGSLEAQQAIKAIVWHPGEHRTPDTRITVQLPGLLPAEVAADPLFFTVPSVLTGQAPQLRAAKPQVAMIDSLPLLAASGTVGGVVLLTLGLLWHRNTRRRRRQAAPAAPKTAYETALAEIISVTQRGLPDTQAYPLVAASLRAYLGARLHVAAADMTTAELTEAVSAHLSAAMQQDLVLFWEQADLVKFARYRPGARRTQLYADLVTRWLRAAERALSDQEREAS
ncbi:MAG: hypothetical protein ACUVSX_05480 [Aggregatilineales bacterium]